MSINQGSIDKITTCLKHLVDPQRVRNYTCKHTYQKQCNSQAAHNAECTGISQGSYWLWTVVKFKNRKLSRPGKSGKMA